VVLPIKRGPRVYERRRDLLCYRRMRQRRMETPVRPDLCKLTLLRLNGTGIQYKFQCTVSR
jgi:hypothetical protein